MVQFPFASDCFACRAFRYEEEFVCIDILTRQSTMDLEGYCVCAFFVLVLCQLCFIIHKYLVFIALTSWQNCSAMIFADTGLLADLHPKQRKLKWQLDYIVASADETESA